jgi:hydrogenase maturation protease
VTLPLVIGLGRADRGDDAVGPEVARTFAEHWCAAADVVESDQPAELMDLWSGREFVVIVDAVRSGAPPGTIHVLPVGADHARFIEGRRSSGHVGTHSLGVETVVGLAAVMGALPSRLVLVGVEGSTFEHGAAMSTAVASAVQPTVAEVMAQVVAAAPEGSGPGRV